MEDLKTLIDMISKLPSMALWVLIGFWAYKVIVVGSIYGVIRFCITKFVEWKTFVKPVQKTVIEYNFKGLGISEDLALDLIAQFRRLVTSKYGYIHSEDVQTLKKLIDEHLKEKQ